MSLASGSYRLIAPFESIVDDGPPIGSHPFRPLVYVFEHRVLPQMAFGAHPEIQRAFQARQTLGKDFTHVWSKSAVLCESSGLWSAGTTEDLDAYGAYASQLWELMACEPTHSADYTVWTVRTPPPVVPGETYFVAFVEPTPNSQDSLRHGRSQHYYTLEMTIGPDAAVLCEWISEGNHLNYGERPRQTSHGFTSLVLNHVRGLSGQRMGEALYLPKEGP